eukprot:TRINITY_DN69881_c0_g1_i1.p1 TRINITY_DN69881_c0_g1~~TRINITY_DN69881_c0_g1_i1.p1  ORF type:complete len:273 (-),score=58.06 TRINITY_DN69881_c0_g1_i1:22-840(-)
MEAAPRPVVAFAGTARQQTPSVESVGIGTPPSPARTAYAIEPGLYDNLVTSIWLDWRNLRTCPELVKADRKVVLQAIQKSSGEALQYAAKELQADREVVYEAVQYNGFLLQYAAEDLRADRNFVMKLCEVDGRALKYASAEIKDDREVVLTAVQRHGQALSDASDRLLGDYELLLAATEKDMSSSKPRPRSLDRPETSEQRVIDEDIERYKAAEKDARRPWTVKEVGLTPPRESSDYDSLLASFGKLGEELREMKAETDKRDAKFDFLRRTC